MKIKEIRATPPTLHLVMMSEGEGLHCLLGEIIFRVDNKDIEIKALYHSENPEIVNLNIADGQMTKLRDWLCELYGLPEKETK